MTAAPTTDRYEMVVGLEVHVQLKTATKMFCSCSTAYGAPPNENTCPVCLALPGALPVINERAIELAARAAAALGSPIQGTSIFARKHYFYPDLPKGYQITQYDRPLATDGGGLQIGDRRVRIARVHVEEDAGKSIHDRYPGASAIDLNRAGVPLIEIVSEPDIRSAAEAGRYLRELRQVMLYLGVSDVNMEEGSLRVDANVSARPRGATKLGTKTEVKNLNSFSNVERALTAEFARQCALLDRGERVTQQTMLWDAAAGTVRPARSKEESHDYRYFPEPDLPPLVRDAAWIEQTRATLPELPAAKRARFAAAYGLPEHKIEVLTNDRAFADRVEDELRAGASATPPVDFEAVANRFLGDVLAECSSSRASSGWVPVPVGSIAALEQSVATGFVSSSASKDVYAELARRGRDDPTLGSGNAFEQQIVLVRDTAERLGLIQVSDDARLRVWIEEVWAEHPTEARRYAAGETKLRGVLVGFVRKKSGGAADPHRVNQLLEERAGG